MIIEFRNIEGTLVESKMIGDSIEVVAATQQHYEQRMVNLGAPVAFAARAAARHMRALANPRPAARSLKERIAAVSALVDADRKAGRLFDDNLRARITAAAKLVDADRAAGKI